MRPHPIRFDNLRRHDLAEARDRHFTALSSIFNGQDPDDVYVLSGEWAWPPVDPYREPERWVEEALLMLDGKAPAVRDPRVFRPSCLEFGPYGVHFIDRMFGAPVFFDEASGQWYNHYLDTPIGSLSRPDLDRDPTWSLARRVAEAFLSHQVTVPLFGLPTIASALNIAVNLYGERILLAMIEEPEAAGRDLAVINETLCALHRWYRERIPCQQLQPVVSIERTQPPGFGQLCGCTTQLLSPDLYESHVAPLDHALLSVYPNGGMIHLCGSHTQHIPTWQAMPSLRAVQLNDRAAQDLDAYFRGLRDDQIIYLIPFDGMPVSRAMAITGGHRLVLQRVPEEPLPIRLDAPKPCCPHCG